ncbi:hypothetical protein EON79_10565 [bacterium]|nr:MAG: hypothetical protein EON79_10565 [bacterium]
MITFALLMASAMHAPAGLAPEFDIKIEETKYASRHVFPGGYALAPRDYRLLVVRYRVYNGASYALNYNRSAVAFAVLNGKDRITTGTAPLRMADHDFDEVKPGQARQDEVWLEVPCDAAEPKLAIRAGGAEKLFSLAATKLDTGPWADAPTTLAVKTGQSVPLGPWDVAVTRVSRPATSPTSRAIIDDGERPLVAEIDFRSAIGEKTYVNAESLIAQLVDRDGKTLRGHGAFFDPKTDERLEKTLGAKARLTTPVAFEVPDDFQPATLRLTEPSTGRSITVAI